MKRKNDKNYKNYPQEITLRLCIQYSVCKSPSKILVHFCWQLTYTVLVTDRSLDHSTSQIHFYITGSGLCSSSHNSLQSTVATLCTCWVPATNCLQVLLPNCHICHFMHFLSTLLHSSTSIAKSMWLSPSRLGSGHH
jgi:hypothetical protein